MDTSTYYASFITAILVVPHHSSIQERLTLRTISWPSIFHSAAWKQFRKTTDEMVPVIMLSFHFMRSAK